MALDPLCAPADVASVLQVEVEAANTAALTAAAADASAFVRSYTRQVLTLVEDDVHTVQAPGSRLLYLPELPVVSISSLVLADETLTDFTVDRDGVVARISPSSTFGPRFALVVVTYSHGYDEVPDDLRAATASIAGRSIITGPGLVGEGIGAHNWRVKVDAAGGLLDLERAVLTNYRKGRP